MAYELQGANDCAIVSIANFCGKTKDEVFLCGEKNIRPDFRSKVYRMGTSHDEVTLLLFFMTNRCWRMRSPRRGQNKITGLCSWHRGNSHRGHMTACIQGNVFDTNGSITPIEEYRQKFGFSLRMVWE
jgi:hypothetical protein